MIDWSDEFLRLKDAFTTLPIGDDGNLKRLRNELVTVVQMAFTEKSHAQRYVSQINKTDFHPVAFVMGEYHLALPDAWRDGQRNMIGLIESMEHHLSLVPSAVSTGQEVSRDSLFIVHGHDTPMLHEIEAFVRRIGLQPVILMEEPSQGRTVIEKIEHYGNVPFAIVLLSPDDIGRAFADPPENEKRRARQNAILELGYFMGKLDRENVCVIVDGELASQTEYPSDMAGVVTIPYRPGGDWKTRLTRELRASNMNFNETAV